MQENWSKTFKILHSLTFEGRFDCDLTFLIYASACVCADVGEYSADVLDIRNDILVSLRIWIK